MVKMAFVRQNKQKIFKLQQVMIPFTLVLSIYTVKERKFKEH